MLYVRYLILLIYLYESYLVKNVNDEVTPYVISPTLLLLPLGSVIYIKSVDISFMYVFKCKPSSSSGASPRTDSSFSYVALL